MEKFLCVSVILKADMKKLIKKLISTVLPGKPAPAAAVRTWKDIEYFEDSWINRIRMMAEFLPDGTTVMDLGCGQMGLPKVKTLKTYIPIDYCKRNEETRVCDFNKKQFPAEKAEYTFVSGCLEYVNDPDWFISRIAKASNHCVISYCSTDGFPDKAARTRLVWVNHLSRQEVIDLFERHGMKLEKESFYQPHNNIFLFSKKQK